MDEYLKTLRDMIDAKRHEWLSKHPGEINAPAAECFNDLYAVHEISKIYGTEKEGEIIEHEIFKYALDVLDDKVREHPPPYDRRDW